VSFVIAIGQSARIIRSTLRELRPLIGLGHRAIVPGNSNAPLSVEATVRPSNTLRIDRSNGASLCRQNDLAMVLDARERFVKVRTLTLIALSVGVLGVVVSIGGEWGHVSALDPIAQMGALTMIVGFVSLPPLTIWLAMCDARWRR
jgi:hypothetical protein